MGKGQATNKKRRAGRYGKVKLKVQYIATIYIRLFIYFCSHHDTTCILYVYQNRNYAKFIPPQIQDPVVRAHWDPRKSPAYNMSKMGLKALANADVKSHGTHSKQEEQQMAVQLFDIPESDVMNGEQSSSRPTPMSLVQQQYITKCIAKYGDNYTQMAKDIKLNNMQHNENQLRKIAARFILLTPEQRKVDLPEKMSLSLCEPSI